MQESAAIAKNLSSPCSSAVSFIIARAPEVVETNSIAVAVRKKTRREKCSFFCEMKQTRGTMVSMELARYTLTASMVAVREHP